MVRSVIFNKIYVYGKKRRREEHFLTYFKSVNLVINFHIFHCIKN